MEQNNFQATYRKIGIGQSNNYTSRIHTILDVHIPDVIEYEKETRIYCENVLEEFMQLFDRKGFKVVNGVYSIIESTDEIFIKTNISEVFHNKEDFVFENSDPMVNTIMPKRMVRIILVFEYKFFNVHTLEPDFTQVIKNIKFLIIENLRQKAFTISLSMSSFNTRRTSEFVGRIKDIHTDYTKQDLSMLPKGKWECQYCESLNNDEDLNCHSCGASRTKKCISWDSSYNPNNISFKEY